MKLPFRLYLKKVLSASINPSKSPPPTAVAKDLIGLDVSITDDYYLRYGMGRFGIADIFVVKPKDNQTETVIETFKQHQQNRMNTFEHYNVDGDYDRAKNALIYEHKGYVILLILTNPQSAQQQINECMK